MRTVNTESLNQEGTSLGGAQQSHAPPTLLIEDFSETPGSSDDVGLTRDCLVPYMRDLYSDLIIRCIQPRAVKAQMLDKITFLQFTCLPGIVAERLFTIMDQR